MNVISNFEIYLAIAEEAHADMRVALEESRTPKPNGEPGYIIRFDPERRSFKSAMVAIAFCGMYIEAIIFIALQERFGRTDALKIDRKLVQEERLAKLGIADATMLARVKAFRVARSDLVHEKAIDPADFGSPPMHVAQSTADSAMSLAQGIRGLLAAP